MDAMWFVLTKDTVQTLEKTFQMIKARKTEKFELQYNRQF